jgi:hypothetical protein
MHQLELPLLMRPWRSLVLIAAAINARNVHDVHDVHHAHYARRARRRRLEACGQMRLADIGAQEFTPPSIFYDAVNNLRAKSALNFEGGELPPSANWGEPYPPETVATGRVVSITPLPLRPVTAEDPITDDDIPF